VFDGCLLIVAGAIANRHLRGLPESITCIGGGYISLELGQMFSRFGSQVTIVERGPRLLSRYEPEISHSFVEVLRNEGIQVLTNAHQTCASDARQVTMTVEAGGRQRDLKAVRLLIATGRRPNTAVPRLLRNSYAAASSCTDRCRKDT